MDKMTEYCAKTSNTNNRRKIKSIFRKIDKKVDERELLLS